MTLSLRLLARSRRLCAMSLLAWLMLVINSLVAAPLGMLDGTRAHAMQGMPMMVTSVDGHEHHSVAGASCCDIHADSYHSHGHGDRVVHQCNCEAMCGNALIPASIRVFAAMAVSTAYGGSLRIHAPSLDIVPLLRPPAV